MSRYFAYLSALLAVVAVLAAAAVEPAWAWGLWLAVPLAAVGTFDLLQSRHTLMRNYPLVGRLRWLLESIRPQVRQYFITDDLHGTPFNREERSIVYARAKGDNDFEPFGTELDVHETGFEWLNHSIVPAPRHEPPRLTIGADQCQRPYSSSLLNISALSFGALGGRAIKALNRGARAGGFAHDTGEGGISVHHRLGGDLIWEIGSGYFGCRTADGLFDRERFTDQAVDPQVQMVEIKLSQGAKAGHGGILPGSKVTAEIARARGVPKGVDCVSPARHSAFSTPIELLEFAENLRRCSGGKPVGIKLCVGNPWEFMAICKAMRKTGSYLDFVVVDGKEGGTGAAPEEFSDRVGMPLRDGLSFANNVLIAAGLKHRVKLGASGKIVTGFDMVRAFALGADWCNAARPFMFALGCVQSLRCHLGTCPTGVATHDPLRERGLVVQNKADRVERFHRQTLSSLMDLVSAAGLASPSEIRAAHVMKRLGVTEYASFAEIYPPLEPEEFLEPARDPWYRRHWERANAGSFAPAA